MTKKNLENTEILQMCFPLKKKQNDHTKTKIYVLEGKTFGKFLYFQGVFFCDLLEGVFKYDPLIKDNADLRFFVFFHPWTLYNSILRFWLTNKKYSGVSVFVPRRSKSSNVLKRP